MDLGMDVLSLTYQDTHKESLVAVGHWENHI